MPSQDLFARVEELTHEGAGTTRSIAEFLALEGSGVANVTMDRIASAAFVSKASLVRFAKQMGFDGWAEFRRAFVASALVHERELATQATVDVNYPFAAGDGALRALDKVTAASRLGADRAREGLDERVLLGAAHAVLGSRCLAVFGRAPNFAYGLAFAYNMCLLGRRCIVPHTEDAYGIASTMGKGDCGVFVSYTGRLAHTPLDYAQRLASAGATVIGITAEGSELARVSDFALTFPGIERFYDKVAGFYSCAAVDYLLNALFVACYLDGYDAYATRRRSLSEELGNDFGNQWT